MAVDPFSTATGQAREATDSPVENPRKNSRSPGGKPPSPKGSAFLIVIRNA